LTNLVVRLVSAQRRVDLDEHDLRHAQAERASNLSCDQFRNQRQDSLPRSAKLHHVQPIIVSFDDGGQ
jgi:hypothetical protein